MIFTPTVSAAQSRQTTRSQAGDTDRVRARTLFSQAEDAFSREEFARAMRLFQQAQDAFFNEAVNFNIAVCLERLNRFAEAIAAYTQVQASPTIDASIKERASAAIVRLQPPVPAPQKVEPQAAALPLPLPPAAPSDALALSSPQASTPLPVLRPVGWVGAASAALGLGAAATVWMLGTANQTSYDNATELQRASVLADRADNYDLALKLSWAVALTGLATVAIDRLWRD